MRFKIDVKELLKIYEKAERDYLSTKGFDPNKEILKLEYRGIVDDDLESVEFIQDSNPDKGGDCIEVEYLKSMNGSK